MSTRLSFRIAALLVAGLCVVAALEARRIGVSSGSPAAKVAAIASLIAAAWIGGAALVPRLITGPLNALGLANWWQRLEVQDAALRSPPGRSVKPILPLALAIWGAACFAANVFVHSLTPPYAYTDDQGAYLERAREMHRQDFPALAIPRFLSDLSSGRFREDNRHPLYLMLLALRPYEAWGRWLAWTFGVSAFLTGIWMVWRRFTPLTAGIFSILVGANADLGQFSVMIVCESLLIWLVSLAFFTLLPAPGAKRTLGRRRGRILLASAWLGLAYMTKGTGLVFFGAFLVWLAWQCRPRGDGDIPPDVEEHGVISLVEAYPLRQWMIAMICGVMGFLVVAEPLLERNIRVFGNPFHNVNSLLLFTDDYSEFDNLLRGGVTTGEAAEEFFRTHTIGQMLDRELKGLVWEAFIMLRMLGPLSLDDGRVLFGAPLAICAGIGLWFDRRPAKFLLFGWIFVCWILFAWYVPIAAGDRFPIPLLLPVCAFAAEGLRRIWLDYKREQPDSEPQAPPAEAPA